MKKLTFVLAFLCTFNLFGQNADTNVVVAGYKLINNYSSTQPVDVDTNLLHFQSYNPIYQYSVSNSWLGNSGSPVIQNVFTDQDRDYDAVFLNNYYPYFRTFQGTSFYTARKPVSALTYSNGDASENKDQTFHVFLSENFTPRWNFGARYDLISTKGQYRFLNVKKNTFQIFSSYLGDRYTMHSSLNFNRYRGDENAGIVDSVFQDTIFAYPKLYPTNFKGSPSKYTSYAQTKIRYYDMGVAQQLKLFTLSSKEDTVQKNKGRNVAEPVLNLVTQMSRATKTYTDLQTNSKDYYDNYYFNLNNTYDSVCNYTLRNSLQLDFKTTFRGKVQLDIYGMMGHEFQTYTIFSQWDSTFTSSTDTLRPIIGVDDTLKGINQKDKFSNVFFSAGFYGNFWNRVKTRISWNIYYLGPKAGQSVIDGFLDTKIKLWNQEYVFGGNFKLENKMPSYFLNHYYSNNYWWDQELLPENRVFLSSFIASPSNKFELRGNYRLLRNYFYYSNLVKPENYNQLFNYFSVELTKTFHYWKLFSENKLIYQVPENKSIVPLPDFIYYTSTYIDHTFKFKTTGGRLQTILGADVYYTTAYQGYGYSPALAQFYLQDTRLLGNYPIVDVFLNIKLKSVRFFAKLEDVNINKYNRYHFSLDGYPYKQISFLFGLSWTFYN